MTQKENEFGTNPVPAHFLLGATTFLGRADDEAAPGGTLSFCRAILLLESAGRHEPSRLKGASGTGDDDAFLDPQGCEGLLAFVAGPEFVGATADRDKDEVGPALLSMQRTVEPDLNEQGVRRRALKSKNLEHYEQVDGSVGVLATPSSSIFR